jgi:hypothetical protein
MSDINRGVAIRNIFFYVIVDMLVLAGDIASAGEPGLNVGPKLHPTLTAAQKLSRQAYDKIVAAQLANEWDMKGHAQRARDLLELVNEELMLAAEAANKNKGK